MNISDKEDNIKRSQFLYTEVANVINGLAGINYALIKGEALSIQAYKGVGFRKFGDIDILIDKINLKYVNTVIKENGFSQGENSLELTRKEKIITNMAHQTTPYVKYKDGLKIKIDLNMNIYWEEVENKNISIESFLEDTVFMDVYGYKIKTLNVKKAFLQLCLHHYREMNSLYHLYYKNPITTNMFKDVYALVKNNSDTLNINCILNLCKTYNVKNYIYYVLFYTNEIFQDNDIENILKNIYDDDGHALLTMYGLSAKERKNWRVDFKTRLDVSNVFDFIRDDFSDEDYSKIERSSRLFLR
ncbi:MAG: nucleotidyltransferase family protein [Defluviitaleaceae bacterium]|nr:nucleotidyltransferase family protein [Defluviitaleaceae bacterium]